MKVVKSILIVVSIFILCLCSKVDINAQESVGYIYVGDSRFVGLGNATDLTAAPDRWLVAVGGMGYDWLVSDAIAEVERIESENTQITKWYEIYNLGVNDPGNMDKYVEFCNSRSVDHNVVYVSVNPVEDYWYCSNSTIEEFNRRIQETPVDYIDLYNPLLSMHRQLTVDQVHFNNFTNNVILNTIDTLLRYKEK